MQNQERRRRRRHKVSLHASIITPSVTVPVYVTDISIDGLRVESSDPILPETVIAVSLSLKEETLLTGQVLWSLEGQRMGHRYYQIGIEIQGVILKDSQAIGFPPRETLVQEIISRVDPVNVAC
ncbi:MAG: PilZ domain-containing protein [Pseudomonadota bacterium]